MVKASLLDQVEKLILSGGYTNEVAWKIIDLVREEDRKDANANA